MFVNDMMDVPNSTSSYANMVFCDPRSSVFNDDHRSTNTPTIASNVYHAMMMIGIHTYELAESTCTTKLTEGLNEARRRSGESDDIAVHIHNISLRGMDFGPSGQRDVYGGKNWCSRLNKRPLFTCLPHPA